MTSQAASSETNSSGTNPSNDGGEPASHLDVIFVCWGNICRSPIAERVARQQALAAGLGSVRFSSAGVSSEEVGEPIDPRAARVLERHGYPSADHVAHQIDAAELAGADLVVAMEQLHVDRLRRLGKTGHVQLLSDFDPGAESGAGLPDPWYGSPDGFEDTLSAIEAAVPGVVETLRNLPSEG